MSILNRPYAGTWAPNKRNVVQWTPDFLVYLNGDTSLPGCQTCRHNIPIMEFINSVSVDFGVEPGASNCSISMTIPRHYGDSLFRDGNTLLSPGLEIHVYFRGYFPMKGLASPNSQPVAGVNLSDIPQHPYYPVFHGVVTQVNHEYSGGFHTATLSCAGMLHFWETQKMSGSSGGSFFGARPVNSGVQTTLTGHPMSGKSPYGIIYSLYRDTAGVADGVGFALRSRTNYGAVNATTGDPLYAMTLRYWEQRFRGKIYGLRMHGASGQLFTSAQQAYLSLYRTNAFGGGSSHSTANVSNSTNHPSDDPFAQDPTLLLGLRVTGADGRVLRQIDTRLAGALSNSGRLGLDVMQLQAFPTDIGSYGQVNLWESTYESKMDIATAVTNVCGYEFYQDADGDLVFKPPLYNLDTSSSRVYRIEPEDIVSINFTEAEPAATYCVIKGGVFQNLKGVVDDSEFGVRSTYVDYKLVAQFGWKEASLESTYYNNAKSAYYFAINYLDRQNAGVNACTVTIPLRPEIRPGYPVYIPHIDCFYYVTQVAHSLNLGSECNTTLTLTARRRKFLPPGASGNQNVSFDQNLSQIDLSATANPVRSLQTLDNNGTPRITGFPNVVLAIDPEKINPLFEVIGFQAVENELTERRGLSGERLQQRRRDFAFRFIRMMLARTPRILEPYNQPSNATSSVNQGVTPSDLDFSSDPNRQYRVVGLTGNQGDVIVTVGTIESALSTYISTRATLKRARALLVNRIVQAQNEINGENQRVRREQQENEARQIRGEGTQSVSSFNPSAQESTISRLRAQLYTFDANFDAVPEHNTTEGYVQQYLTLANIVNSIAGNRDRLNVGEGRNEDRTGTVLISFLISQFRTAGPQSRDTSTDPSGTTNQSALLLESLSDRKASLSLTVPGHYRYYSASHPNPVMQGYADIRAGAAGSTTTSGSEESTVNRQGRVTGASRNVPAQRTPLTPEQIAGYVINAYREIYGRNPPTNVAEIITAQSLLETGRGEGTWNNNFGGVKAVRGGLRYQAATNEGSAAQGTRQRVRAFFQAYGSPEEGARHFVRILVSGTHHNAIQQYLQAFSQGYDAAARAYVTALKRTQYFSDDIETYLRNLPLERARRAVANPDRARRSRVDAANAPENAPSSQTQTPPGPETPITTYGVRPITDGQGIPEDRLGQYVELFSGHRPTKGLRVRTIERSGYTVIPTNLIYAMTIEARERTHYTRAAVPRNNPFRPREVSDFINLCLQPSGPTGPILEGLVNGRGGGLFEQQVGSSPLSQVRTTVEEIRSLIELAVGGIDGLRTATGLIGTDERLQTQQIASEVLAAGTGNPPAPIAGAILNITNGIPNDYNPSGITSTRNAREASSILRSKAAALLHEVTLANAPQLRQAQVLISRLGPNERLTTEILDLLQPWQQDLQRIYRGNPLPQVGPFRAQVSVSAQRSDGEDYSPVFPVSDALGYEHYGSFQYGRGLSIEPGGNYERLMATDPFQYLTDTQREAFLRALRSNANNPQQRAAAIRESLTSIANDPAFLNGPGAQVALDYLENDQRNGDRTTMIANGLRNYILSDRDATMKMPVNNVAYQLADLAPMGQQDTCECRGAEADLLLAAYMAGTENFALVTSSEEATVWAASQIEQAAGAWSEAQSRMRGMSEDQGRRSLLDTVEGWKGVVDNFRTSNQSNVAGANAVAGSAEAVSQNFENRVLRRPVPNRGQ